MPQLVMAIDAGTTGIAVVLVDTEAAVRARAYGEVSQHYPRPGWVEHDPMEIWDVTQRLMGQAVREAGASRGDIATIGITNQRETVVLWERRSGDPVAPAIVWQDRRTAGICERLAAEGLEEEVSARTGLRLDPYFSGTKLLWYLDNLDGARPRAEAGELAFGTIDSWLLWKLSDGRVHATGAFERVAYPSLFAPGERLGSIHARQTDDPRETSSRDPPEQRMVHNDIRPRRRRCRYPASPATSKPLCSDKRVSRMGWLRTPTAPAPSY